MPKLLSPRVLHIVLRHAELYGLNQACVQDADALGRPASLYTNPRVGQDIRHRALWRLPRQRLSAQERTPLVRTIMPHSKHRSHCGTCGP